MGSLLLLVVLAVSGLSYSVADLPRYCGPDVDQFINYKKVPKDEGTLRQVHMAIRHGDRIQVNGSKCWKDDKAVWDCLLTEAVVPTINRDQHYMRVERLYRKVFDTGKEELPGNCALGQLTSIGFKQLITNGERFRKVYVDSGFLSTNFTTRELYVRSDDMFRTMQSAQMFMTGMYPPSQPVEGRAGIMDINTMDPTFEDIYPNAIMCPKLKEYSIKFFQSPGFLLHYKNVTSVLLKDLQVALGEESFDFQDLFQLFDCLNVHLCHRVEIPAGITPVLYQRVMDEISWLAYSLYVYPSRQELSRVGIGFLIKDMFQEINDMIAGESLRKFLFYSGHDATIMPLLSAFNVSDGQWSPYASQFIIEVYEMPGATFSMRIIYNGKILKLPFCKDSDLCDMDTVNKYVENIVPKDRETACY